MFLLFCANAAHAWDVDSAAAPPPQAASASLAANASPTDPTTQAIVNYLLGLSGDAANLDQNGDSRVTVEDLVYAINHRAPTINTFSLAGGAASTPSRTVTLNNACTGGPTSFMASESATFSGASWQPYATAPTLTLSTGNLLKRVYFKVKNAAGVESPVLSDTITLAEITPLTVGAAAVAGNISPAGDVDAYQFTVAAASTYTIETWPGTLTDNYMRLYGPGNMTALVAQDHYSSANKTARISLTLAPGAYYAKVQAFAAAGTGGYTIKVTNLGALKVNAFAINNGAASAASRTVSLANACTGSPTHYMASESASFAGAAWLPYKTISSFTLGAGNMLKRVYFKVKDAGGTESPVVSDTITLTEVNTLAIGAAAVSGSISPAGDSDWWQFTVTATSSYAVESWPGTLADNAMALYGPGSMNTLLASDDNSGDGNAAKLALTLKAGTYYVKIQAAVAGATGDYTIGVSNLGALKVDSFKINGGASLATARAATLNNACTGAPTHYKASESSSFSGAAWQPYATAPAFTLSDGNESKRVYYKVKDLAGTESAVVSDSITLQEMTPLPTDGTIVGGKIGKTDEEDWYSLTVDTSGLYTIQTYAGSLADTIMGVSAIPDPGTGDWIVQNNDISDSDPMSQVTVWLPAGTYYVQVMSGDASTGSYTIRAWQPANKKLSVNGSTVTGNISSATDVDWYQFTITSSGIYSIVTEADGLTDGYMELYSSSFKKIALNENRTGLVTGAMPAITASLAADTYIVRFVGSTEDDTGSYTINVRSGGFNGELIALAINGPQAGGTITDPSVVETDFYQFIVTTQDTYTIQMTAGSLEKGYMFITDEDPDNVLADDGSQSAGDMPEIKDLELIPGTYYIGVQGYSTTDSGSYKIRVKD